MNRLLTALVVLLALTACDDQSTTETRSYDVVGTVTAATVDSYGGRITIVTGDSVRVTETLRYNESKPDPEHHLDGGRLTFTSGCQGHRGNCGVDYRIEVPAAANVSLDSNGGRITVEGLSGDLTLSSGGGAVDASAISSPAVTARTGGGAAHLEFAAAPRTVRVDSAGGDVTLRLPRESYSVDAETEGGAAAIEVADDPTAARTVEVRSRGGDVRVTPATDR